VIGNALKQPYALKCEGRESESPNDPIICCILDEAYFELIMPSAFRLS
jgi:hypothetical protein